MLIDTVHDVQLIRILLSSNFIGQIFSTFIVKSHPDIELVY